MPSPFPGVDPYLEQPELWSEVHSRLIVAIADYLADRLSDEYRIAIEKRVYAMDDESLLIGIPDVAILPKSATASATATLAPPTSEPITVEIPIAENVQERYLEVREVATGAVIVVIEILSPKNKRPGEGLNAYLKKRHQILASSTHLVEIDLLRGGQPLPMKGSHASDYRILVSRSDRRPSAQLYAFNLRQPIPTFPLPLNPGSELIDLQMLFQQVYDRGRYRLAVDYRKALLPALSQEDADWVKQLAI